MQIPVTASKKKKKKKLLVIVYMEKGLPVYSKKSRNITIWEAGKFLLQIVI